MTLRVRTREWSLPTDRRVVNSSGPEPSVQRTGAVIVYNNAVSVKNNINGLCAAAALTRRYYIIYARAEKTFGTAERARRCTTSVIEQINNKTTITHHWTRNTATAVKKHAARRTTLRRK